MNRREKCRCISLVLVGLLAVAGVVAMIYGGVHIFKVSPEAATADGAEVQQMLSFFFKCSDLDGGDSSTVTRFVKHQCMARQLPARMAMGFAAGFMILAILCVPAAFKKDKMFGFTMWSTLAIATMIMAVVVVSIYALPAAVNMTDCRNYDQTTVSALESIGVVCIKGPAADTSKSSALKWMCKLHTFYAGTAASFLSLLLFFMIKHCCCCNPNSCGASACGGAANGAEHPCFVRRAMYRFRARFCRRAGLASQADQDNSLPVGAPSYYEANHSEASEGASEDAGATPANNYYGVN
jgi:uncharacterized membrane protein